MPENVRPPDKTQVQQAIVRAQQDGLAKLRQAQVADQPYLLASQRIASLCFESLRLLDEMYLELEQYVSRAGRSQPHQQWLEDRAAHLLQQVELGINASVATGIRHLGNELTSRPREVIREVIVPRTPASYKRFARLWFRLVVTTAVALIAWGIILSLV